LVPHIFSLLLLSVTGWSQTTVHDPFGVLPQIRAFSGTTPFQNSFRCGDVAILDAFVISCRQWEVSGSEQQGWQVSSECMHVADPEGVRVRREVYNCTPDSVSFLLDATGDSTDLTRTDFERNGLNVGESFLSQIAAFSGYSQAELTLQALESTQYTLRRGTSRELRVPAIHVRGQLGEPGKMGVEVLITVIRDSPGVAQIARFRMHGKTWFLLYDFEVTTPRRRVL